MNSKYYVSDPASNFGLLKADFFDNFDIRRRDKMECESELMDCNQNLNETEIDIGESITFIGNDLDLSSDNNADISNNNIDEPEDKSSSSDTSHMSSSRHGIRYPIAFKIEVSKYMKTHTTREASKKFGISSGCASRWRNFHETLRFVKLEEPNKHNPEHERDQTRRTSISVETNDPVEIIVDVFENSLGIAEELIGDLLR